MALTCGFYNSVDGDRKYDATQFASLFDGVITDGVVAAVGDFFATTPGGGMVVNVGSGRAWFNRTWTYSDAKIPLTLDVSDLLYDRIDAIVLEIDTSVAVRDNSIKIVKGIPSQSAEKPILKNEENVYQYALSYVQVRAGTIEIGAGDITINVGKEDCPFVTSIVETPDLSVLFAQWEVQFTEWFDNVQSQLEGDIATNLQKQIDDLKLDEYTFNLYGLNKEDKLNDVIRRAGLSFVDSYSKNICVVIRCIYESGEVIPGIPIIISGKTYYSNDDGIVLFKAASVTDNSIEYLDMIGLEKVSGPSSFETAVGDPFFSNAIFRYLEHGEVTITRSGDYPVANALIGKEVDICAVGGGGSGGIYSFTSGGSTYNKAWASGGAGGRVVNILKHVLNTSRLRITVGAGGERVTHTYDGSNKVSAGNTGGSTVVNDGTTNIAAASGGSGGPTSGSTAASGGSGAAGLQFVYSGGRYRTYAGVSGSDGSSGTTPNQASADTTISGGSGQTTTTRCYTDGELFSSAGGSVAVYEADGARTTSSVGQGGGVGKYISSPSSNQNAGDGTTPGSGGGAIVSHGNTGHDISSGGGADGLVKIRW